MPRISIHQALHGYQDGHRQIAISVSLKQSDSKTLLTLSDSSGPGVRFPENGYLSGYPLLESGYYVFARTWPAQEMPRPGCVWTHSLLIDFSDLAIIPEMGELVSLFHRPDEEHFSGFDRVISWEPNSSSVIIEEYSSLVRLLSFLYDEPHQRILATVDMEVAESNVLKIWSQQWPRLKRNFRFCTCAATDRSTKFAPFDLQILPSNIRTIRSRFTDVLDADKALFRLSDWLKDAVSDIEFPDINGLRTFLRQVGSDIGSGREAFVALCRLHNLLNDPFTENDLPKDAIELFQENFQINQGQTIRLILSKLILENIFKLDDTGFFFLLDNIELIALHSNSDLLHFVFQLWEVEPSRLETLYAAGGGARALVVKTIEQISTPSLATCASKVLTLLDEIIKVKPDVVAEISFWCGLGLSEKLNAIANISMDTGRARQIAAAMIKCGRRDIVSDAVFIFGEQTIAETVIALDPQIVNSEWIKVVASKPNLLASIFSSRSILQRLTLVRFAMEMTPDALPNEWGRDPWIHALDASQGEIDNQEASYLNAFLIARAFGAQTNFKADLLTRTFHSIYMELTKNQISISNWQIIEKQLQWSPAYWDRCLRLIDAVTRTCIDHALPHITLHLLTPDDGIFSLLVEYMAKTRNGRNYLRNIVTIMRASGESKYIERIYIIKNII